MTWWLHAQAGSSQDNAGGTYEYVCTDTAFTTTPAPLCAGQTPPWMTPWMHIAALCYRARPCPRCRSVLALASPPPRWIYRRRCRRDMDSRLMPCASPPLSPAYNRINLARCHLGLRRRLPPRHLQRSAGTGEPHRALLRICFESASNLPELGRFKEKADRRGGGARRVDSRPPALTGGLRRLPGELEHCGLG